MNMGGRDNLKGTCNYELANRAFDVNCGDFTETASEIFPQASLDIFESDDNLLTPANTQLKYE